MVQRLDAAGAVLSVDAYDAWGAQLAGAGDDPYGYKGQVGYYTDGETGLILCTHRYYDPETGRWVNRDPIGYGGGINIYGYCTNDPVNAVDPSGLLGHHIIPQSVYNDPNYKFSKEVKSFFSTQVTGRITEYESSPHNGLNIAHRAYSHAVRNELNYYLTFLKARKLITKDSEMTVAQAGYFVKMLQNTNIPAINNYNSSIWVWIEKHKRNGPLQSGGGEAAVPTSCGEIHDYSFVLTPSSVPPRFESGACIPDGTDVMVLTSFVGFVRLLLPSLLKNTNTQLPPTSGPFDLEKLPPLDDPFSLDTLPPPGVPVGGGG